MTVNAPDTKVREIIRKLESMSNPSNKEGMARFGINVDNALCISMPALRKYAKETGKDHALALALWDTGIHEARIMAALIDVPKQVTEAQLDKWAAELDSWDVCDQCCSNLFDKTGFAYGKCFEWSKDEREFVKRAGFVMMATLAVHDKKADDEAFKRFFPVMLRECGDDRNFVRKAVNWALRQVGKRNLRLNREAIEVCNEMKLLESKSARWIASDALRELQSAPVQEKLKNRS
jgi:3-methyladenine DNA glycosylase AlkD